MRSLSFALYGNHSTLETLHFQFFVHWEKKLTSTSSSLVETDSQHNHMLQKHPRLLQGESEFFLIIMQIVTAMHINPKTNFLSNRLIFGFHSGSFSLFCIFAKIHLFLARRSAANIDFNRCNDTSVPRSQQRYNPNVLKGIIIESSLAIIQLHTFIILVVYSKSQRVDDQLFHNFQYVVQIVGLLSYIILPFLYILLTPSVRKHVLTIFNLRWTSVTPEVH